MVTWTASPLSPDSSGPIQDYDIPIAAVSVRRGPVGSMRAGPATGQKGRPPTVTSQTCAITAQCCSLVRIVAVSFSFSASPCTPKCTSR